jgi:hypothetical protein
VIVDDPNDAIIGLDVDEAIVGDDIDDDDDEADENEEEETEIRLTILECLSNNALNDFKALAISSSTI